MAKNESGLFPAIRVQADDEPLTKLMTNVFGSALDVTWIKLSASLTHCISRSLAGVVPTNLRLSGRPLTAVKGMVQSVGLDVNPRTCLPFLSLTTLRKRM